ncbi:MAG: TPM domain-containing protein [Pseudoflavonifractor sp.]|nr:TPM domain-containing protein [Pseudoflavonifractor sp.]
MRLTRYNIINIVILTIAALTAPAAMAYTIDEIPNVHVADRTRYVSNPDGILSPEAQTRTDSIIADIWRTTSAEVVAVIVNSIGDEDPTDFATRLYSKWGIGKADNDNGLLVLVVKDQHKVTLRTGYGMEGVMPDALTAHVWRDYMIPSFKTDDYDGGMLSGLGEIHRILTVPGAAAELRSKYANDRNAGNGESDLWSMYVRLAVIMTAIALVMLLWTLLSSRGRSTYDRYQALSRLKVPLLVLSFLALGMPLPLFLFTAWQMKRLRNKPHKCQNCGHVMKKLDENTDNMYLTPAQDFEERINSVDYDVWLCPQCNATDILPFVNKQSGYTVCNRCGARACTMSGDHILRHATATREGQGVKDYTCRHCHAVTSIPYVIPVAAAPLIIGGGGGRGGFGGGGFSGGSFGGGMTGGGGSTGSW